MIKSSAPARAHRHTIRSIRQPTSRPPGTSSTSAKPDGWFVGQPMYHEHRREWKQNAHDTREKGEGRAVGRGHMTPRQRTFAAEGQGKPSARRTSG